VLLDEVAGEVMSRPPFEKPQRFYRHHLKLYWTYWTRYTWWNNKHFNNDEWHMWEEWCVFIGIKQPEWKWFGYDDFYYDGHTAQIIYFAGLVFGKGYGYDSRPVKEEA